jgi:hypothetical protein
MVSGDELDEGNCIRVERVGELSDAELEQFQRECRRALIDTKNRHKAEHERLRAAMEEALELLDNDPLGFVSAGAVLRRALRANTPGYDSRGWGYGSNK